MRSGVDQPAPAALPEGYYLGEKGRLLAIFLRPAGTALEIGRGKPWNMPEIIAARDPAAAGATLPPHALYLMHVRY